MRALSFVIALACALAAGTAVAGDKIAVPDLRGKTSDEAQALIDKAGFLTPLELDLDASTCDGPTEDHKIRCQSPAPGTVVDHYTYIHVAIYVAPRGERRLLRDDLAKLIGMTVDQAKAQLEKWGHDGAVNVATEQQFIKKCGIDKVCETEPDAMGIHDDITLFINPKLKIAAPPP